MKFVHPYTETVFAGVYAHIIRDVIRDMQISHCIACQLEKCRIFQKSYVHTICRLTKKDAFYVLLDKLCFYVKNYHDVNLEAFLLLHRSSWPVKYLSAFDLASGATDIVLRNDKKFSSLVCSLLETSFE